MTDIPTTEPNEIRAGDTIKWKRTDPSGDYPASLWTLEYYLVNSSGQEKITAAADGDNFLITIDASASAGYAAGTYKWISKVVKGSEKYTDRQGTIEILPDLEAATSGLDARSDVKIALDNITTIIKNIQKHSSYSIAGRTYVLKDLPDLMKTERELGAKYQAEINKEKVARGGKTGNKVLFKFK